MPNLTIPHRHRVRKDVQDVMMRTFTSVEEGVSTIELVFKNHNMLLGDYNGEKDVVRILAGKGYNVCGSCTSGEYPPFDNTFNVSWELTCDGYQFRGYIT